jgi:anti-sigma factor RsiW
MTESRNGNMPRDGEPDMSQGDHELAMWDAAYVLGALSDADRLEFEAHLVGCISCREAVTELTAVSPLLSRLDYDQVIAPDASGAAVP